jgi:hypothetical protein
MSNCSRCSMVVNPRNEGKQSPKCTSFLAHTRTIIGRQQHMHFFVFCRFATAAMGMPNLKTKEAGVVQYKTKKKTNQSEHNNNKRSTTNNHCQQTTISTNNHFQQTTTFNKQPLSRINHTQQLTYSNVIAFNCNVFRNMAISCGERFTMAVF